MHHVGAERFFPSFGRIADGERADIADHGVDPAKFGRCVFDPCLQGRRIRNIDRASRRFNALGNQGFHGLADMLGVAPADRDISAFIGKDLRDRKPDALAAAADDYVLSPQSEVHCRLHHQFAPRLQTP
jgi:hypothetical protein